MKKLLVALIGFPLAFVVLIYRRKVKEFIGDVGFAERWFGMGGTNTLVVLLALGIFIGTLMYVTGSLQGFLEGTIGRIF